MVGGLWAWVWAWLGVIWLCSRSCTASHQGRLESHIASSRRAGARGGGHHDGTTPKGLSRAGGGIGSKMRCV